MFAARKPESPRLAPFVDLLWLYDGYAVTHAKERLMPQGTMELVINLREDRFSNEDTKTGRRETFRGAVLAGVYSEFSLLDTAESQHVIGVHFKPGGAFPFLRIPASELHNAQVGLDDVWGSRARELRDEVIAAPTAEARLATLERALLAAARTYERHDAVAWALQHLRAPRTQTISEVTNAIGISTRRFTDVFRNEVGLAPKVFHRVRRFHTVLQRVAKMDAGAIDWSDVALSCGYFDQPHFIHDFREFSGFTPTEYLARRGEHLGHVPLV